MSVARKSSDCGRWCWSRSGAIVAVLAGVLGGGAAPVPASSGSAESGDVTARVQRLGAQLIAPCCFAQTIDNHSSPVTEEIKRDIRQRLRDGQSETAILEVYRERYGERILAAPRAHGFNVLAYVVPPLFLAAGFVLGGMWLRRRVRQAAGAAPTPSPIADPRLRARLDAELARVEP